MLLFKVSHGLRCLYTIDLFKKNLTYINSIIPFLQLLRIFVGLVVLCCVLFFCFFLFFDKLSHVKGYLETPDSHIHMCTLAEREREKERERESERERKREREGERERDHTIVKISAEWGNLEIRCKDVVSV